MRSDKFLVLMERIWWAMVAVIVIAMCTPDRAHAATVEFLVILQHTSDLERGCPFNCDTPEPTAEYYAIGATIHMRAFEIDLTHGTKSLNSPTFRPHFESGSQVTARWYPGRYRRQL